MAHERKTGRVMAIKGFVQLWLSNPCIHFALDAGVGQLSGIPHSEYYLLNILSEKVLTSQAQRKE
jgi:hypothetical protein